MKNSQIEHRGVVECVVPHGVRVAIVQETACAACAAASLCHSAEHKEKVVEAHCSDASRYQKGQEVTVVGDMSLGLQAVLWTYVVPLVLLMTVLMGASRLAGSDGVAALAALASLVPYYGVLYLLRDRLQRRFSFRIKE